MWMKWISAWLALFGFGLAAGCTELPEGGGSPPMSMDAAVLDVQTLDASGQNVDAGAGGDGGGVDAATIPPEPSCELAPGACDPRSPDSCGETLTCVIEGETTSCASQPTLNIREGQSCAYGYDCTPGLSCVNTRSRGPICMRPCCPSAGGDCMESERCASRVRDSEGRELLGWGVCRASTACNPLQSDRSCEEGEACYVVSAERRTDCRAEGTGTRGSACRAANDCAAGFYCQERMDRAGTCVRLCALDAPECPEAEGRCQEFALIPAGLGLCQEAAAARE